MTGFDINYAQSGNLNIAYGCIGKGPDHLVLIPGWVSNIEEIWNFPGFTEFIQAIAKYRRIVLFDKRGTGLSDRVNEADMPDLAVRIDDLRAIMDQEKIENAAVMGVSEGGPMALLFSVTYPEKVSSLIIIGSYACWIKGSDNAYGFTLEQHMKTLNSIDSYWSKGFGLKGFAPSWFGNESYEKIWASFLRQSASPGTAKALYRMNLLIDIRNILDEVKHPCLIIHRKCDRIIPFELGEFLARQIPQARLLELEGSDHLFWIDPDGKVRREIGDFLGLPIRSLKVNTTIFTVVLIEPGLDTLSIPTYKTKKALNNSGHNRHSVLTFRSPSEGIKAAKDIYEAAGRQVKILMHTGSVTIDRKIVSGPAIDVLEEITSRISRFGIWISEVSRQFFIGPQITWAQTCILPSPSFPHPVSWYLLAETGKSARLEHFLVFRDNKLNSNDIAALLDVKDFLDINFQGNPSLKELSYYSGLNNFKLKYGFRKLFGIPAKKYVLDLRFEFARKLVRETNLPILEVARKIGYRQLSSFSRTFRTKFGVSPLMERKQNSL